MIGLEVMGIRLLTPEDPPVLLLKDEGGSRCLPIWIGNTEAAAIAVALEGAPTQRPMTHDLLATILQLLSPEPGSVVITTVEDGIYRSEIRVGGQVIEARPSDAVAVAVRLGWPVSCPRRLMDEVGVEVDSRPADEVEAFRAFLDSVNADDFEENT